MQLSVFFRSYYTWLDQRAAALTLHLTADLLHRFVHEVTLMLACEHEILRPGLLDLLLGNAADDGLRARLCDQETLASVEQKLSRLPRAASVAIFQFEMTLVRDALALAGLRAESWALFAEAVLSAEQVEALEARVARCHEQCGLLPLSEETTLRVDLVH